MLPSPPFASKVIFTRKGSLYVISMSHGHPSKFDISMLPSNFRGKITDFRFEQSLKAMPLMLITLSGISMLLRLSQQPNACHSMLITPLEIATFVKLEQCENELSPIVFTVLGIKTLVNPPNSENAFSPIFVTPLGIATSPLTPETSNVPSFDSNKPLMDIYDGFSSATS